jgi:Na+/H+ antiporter NhaA
LVFSWANSPYADSYFALWDIPITITIGSFAISESLGHWVNDALMVIFFFVIGLEIKRELLVGELSSIQKSLSSSVCCPGRDAGSCSNILGFKYRGGWQ